MFYIQYLEDCQEKEKNVQSINIPALKVFYQIIDTSDSQSGIGSYAVGMVDEDGRTFHGQYSIHDTQRTQRGEDVWFTGNMDDIGSEMVKWLLKRFKASMRRIQLATWDPTSSWKAISKFLSNTILFSGDIGVSSFPSYIIPGVIDVRTLHMVGCLDSMVSFRQDCYKRLSDEQKDGMQALVEAEVTRLCYIKLITKADPTDEITTMGTPDIMDIVDFIETWGLGYIIGRAVMNIYNANDAINKDTREVFLKRAILCLEHAIDNSKTLKLFERDNVFYRKLSQSEFITKHSAGNANIDNAILDITVARQYPTLCKHLLEVVVEHLTNELREMKGDK